VVEQGRRGVAHGDDSERVGGEFVQAEHLAEESAIKRPRRSDVEQAEHRQRLAARELDDDAEDRRGDQQRVEQQVSGRGGVTSNAVAVTGNLTITQQSSAGFLYIGPAPVNDPTSSNLNFPLGDDRANAVTVALGGGGTLGVTYAAGTLGPTAHVIFDVTGFFTPDSSGATTYVPLNPTRLLDTRYGTGLGGVFSSHVARSFPVANHGGVAANATAVTGNLTVTGQTSAGFLYIGPNSMDNPTSSTLNFPMGDDRANAVTVALGGGSLSITYAAGTLGPSAHVIFDVTGYFSPDMTGATYVPLTPTRLLDTRYGTGLGGAFTSHGARTWKVGSVNPVPSSATAVTGNLTVTGQSSAGFLFIGPVAINDPTSSNLNFPYGDDRANAVAIALGGGGNLSITYAAGMMGPVAQVIFDVTGYFTH
jgi:serine protease inhibitor ecotin